MAWRKPSNLRDWLNVLFRHRFKFFFTAIPVALAVVIASHYVPREFTASAIIRIGNDLAIQQMGSSATDQAARPMRTLLAQDLTSRKAVAQVIDDLELTRDLPHTPPPNVQLTPKGRLMKDELSNRLRDSIRVKYLARTGVIDQIRVSCTDEDGSRVRPVVNKLVDNYIQSANELFDQSLIAAKGFFDQQVARYRARLETSEADQLRFEVDNPGLDPSDPVGVDAMLVKLTAQLETIEHDIAVLVEERRRLQAWVKGQPQTIVSKATQLNPEYEMLIRSKEKLEGELFSFLSLIGTPTERHPEVRKKRRAIAVLNAKMAATEKQIEIEQSPVPNVTRIEKLAEIEGKSGVLTALETKRSELVRQISTYDDRKRNFVPLRNQYMANKREIENNQAQLAFWENSLRRTQLALAAAVGNRSISLRVIDRPKDIIRPSFPTAPKIILAALVLGLGAAAVITVLAEMLDHSFHSVEHAVDDLKLPVLGAVNEIVTPAEAFRRRVWAWGVCPGVAAVMLAILAIAVYLAYLSLSDPISYQQLMGNPLDGVGRVVLGAS